VTPSARMTLAALLVLLPLAALADPKDDARKRFVEGVELAKAGDFRGAIERFREADAIFRHPATTYNIAFAHQELGQYEEAIRWYRTLILQSPLRTQEIEGVVAELEARIAARRPVAVEPAPPAVAPAGAALATDEIDRLRAIAAELEQLALLAAERGAASPERPPVGPADAGPADDGPADPAAGDGPSAPLEGGFVSDAYERVVVTASRYGQAPLDSPSTISVITSDAIRMSGAIDVSDLLRRVAGVDVMSMSAGQPEVSIRGFNRELNNKVLVLIDGRSVYWDFIGTTQWRSFPIVLDEIERVEVIRGPGSAVYGANAVTGVVNIITKTPGEDPQTTVRYDGGLPGVARGTAFTNGRRGETAWRLSAGYEQHGRWERPEDVGAGSGLVPFTDNQDLAARAVRAHGRIDRSFGKDAVVSLSGGFVDGEAEIYNLGVLGNYGRRTTDTYLRVDGAAGPVHARVFWNRVAGSTGPWAAVPSERRLLLAEGFLAQTLDAELEAFGEIETGPVAHRLNGGVGYRRKSVEGFTYLEGDVVEHHLNAFVNEEATVGAVKVVASLRADRHPLISLDKTLSPRGAAIVRVAPATSVRVTGGTAFRVPTLVESYMDIAIPTDVDGVIIRDFGSRALVPERILTVEVGLHDESSLYHTADVVVYYNRVSNLIGLAPLTPLLQPYDPSLRAYVAGQTGWINLPDVYQGFGVEADGTLAPADGLDLFANVAVQRILRDSPGQPTAVDGSASLFKANAGVQYRSPYRVDLSLAGHFVGAQTWALREFDASGGIQLVPQAIPARLLVSSRVAARPFPNDDLELSISGWNLLALANDLRGREHPKGQRVGPRILGSVSYTF
jgi:outer membrane receptor protein involved in Fe transport